LGSQTSPNSLILHQLKACNVYYKTQLMLCIQRVSKAPKNHHKPPFLTSLRNFLAASFRAIFGHPPPPPASLSTTYHLHGGYPPKEAPKWPKIAPISCSWANGTLFGHFFGHRWPPTATHDL